MHDPDVILRVHAHADRHPEHPAIRQRLWKHRIDFEPRRLDHAVFGLGGGLALEQALGRAQHDKRGDEDGGDRPITRHALYAGAEDPASIHFLTKRWMRLPSYVSPV